MRRPAGAWRPGTAGRRCGSASSCGRGAWRHSRATATRAGSGGSLEPAATRHGALAQAQRLRRDLEQLVLADPLQTLLEVHDAWRCQLDALIRGRRPHIRKFLFFCDVDVQVVVARVLADNLALVDRLTGGEEHRAARLEIVDGVAGRLATAVGHEGAVLTVGDVALPLVPPIEEMVQEAGAARFGQGFGAVAKQAS